MSEWRGWLISVDSKATGRRLPGSKIYAVRIADPEISDVSGEKIRAY